MEVIILRHGEAGTRLSMPSKDSERSLTVAGRKEVEQVAESLVKSKLAFDHIITSPLKRSSETASIVAKVAKRSKALEMWDELKPEGDREMLYRRLSKLKPDASVLVVGHEPYLSEMIGEVVAGNSNASIILKKAGAAKLNVTSFAPRITGELRWLLTPKQLRKMS